MDEATFLARLRRSSKDGSGPAPPDLRPAPAPPEDPSERLARELEAVGGRVHRARSAAEAGEAVARILEEKGARRVVRAHTPLLAALALDEALAGRGIEVGVADARLADREAIRRSEFEADAGITAIDYGVAETGTLVVAARPGQGRAVSLLPPVHIGVLRRRDVVDELSALFDRLARESPHPPSALTFITGPSRTADIELVLTVGVHGPGELHLVLVD